MNKYRDENGHFTTKENNNGPCFHSDTMKDEDTNYERFLAFDNNNAIQSAKKIFDKVKSLGNYGTFDFNGKEISNRYSTKGYQVSAFRPEIFDVLSDKEINELVHEVIKYLNYLDYPDIGVYGSSAELSHYSNNKNKALNIAKLFNQESILSWSKTSDKDNGHFIDNPYYDPNKKLTREDFIKALEELKNE